MTLPSGFRLGVYEVISLIGRGGMGEVYRARDTRLGRDVALKTLPDAVATDPDFLSRFEREARVLASLSHPNIAVIHGVEETPAADASGGRPSALVMEFVEGETLADRLRRGRLAPHEALDVAGQIADALEAAHQRGVVHRDLKPANVKITPSGVVKVLDFGLAKTLAPDSPDGVTLSGTGAVVLIGTPGYMAPEQAQGKPADTRVDVWAFGVVLYEMLTGERLFRGESMQDTLTAVLTEDPRWSLVPAVAQPLLRACLERDPRRRLRDIGDARFLLAPTAAMAASAPKRSRAWLAAIAVGLIALLLVFVSDRLSLGEQQQALVPVHLSTLLPAGASVTRGPGYTSSVAVSPDGSTLVIAGSDQNGQRLYRRPLDTVEPVPLAGSERGSAPFFSWNGEWIGFFADGRLKRIPAAGGAAVDIAAAPGFPGGASWGADDRIVFAFGATSALYVVSAEGGTLDTLKGVSNGRHPEVLPDARTILFESDGWIHAFDRQTHQSARLVAGAAPRYAAGHLIFSRGTTLLAARTDLARDKPLGTISPVADHVAIELPGSGGGRHYALSASGTLAFVPAADAYALVVVDTKGVERRIAEHQRSFENPRFSPDGRYVVVATRIRQDEPTDLWMHDLENGTATRLTFGGGRAPVWMPDGTGVTYSRMAEPAGIYTKGIDGTSEPRQLFPMSLFNWLVGWTPDASTLLYAFIEKGVSSIEAWNAGERRTIVGPQSTWGGRLSKDGRLLVYYLLENGTFNVYVRSVAGGDAHWHIAEGTDPAWAPDGKEIYYRSGPRLMAAGIDTSSGIRVRSRRVVIDPFLPPLYDDYDLHPKDGSIVLVRPANRTQGREVTMVVNWFSEFGRKE